MGKMNELLLDIEESGGFDNYIKDLEDKISKLNSQDEQYKKLSLYLILAKEWKSRYKGE